MTTSSMVAFSPRPVEPTVFSMAIQHISSPCAADAALHLPRAMSPAKKTPSTTPTGSPTGVCTSWTPPKTEYLLVSTTPSCSPTTARISRSSARKQIKNALARARTPSGAASRTPFGVRTDNGNSSPLSWSQDTKSSSDEPSDSSGSSSSQSEDDHTGFDFSQPVKQDEIQSFGSPVAKRKSMHGEDSSFVIFDSTPSETPRRVSYSRKSSSLRRSTMKQRHGERAQLFAKNDIQPFDAPKQHARPRLSIDSFGATPSLFAEERAPLSRTESNTSSGSSVMDDSPTHVPAKNARVFDFSKSLPIGAVRPSVKDMLTRRVAPKPVATPYHASIKPEPRAFMSTGLISKRNRQPSISDGPSMPETPCKRIVGGFYHPVKDVQPSALNTSFFGKQPLELDSPSVVRNGNIFGLPKQLPRPSVASRSISQSSSDFEFPITPTKFTDRPQTPAMPAFAENVPIDLPRTPSELIVPPDPSTLSISGPFDRRFIPNTPIARDNLTVPSWIIAGTATPATQKPVADIDSSVMTRFSSVDVIGKGEFSTVYRGIQRNTAKVFAVKKTNKPYLGVKDRDNKLREVRILKQLLAGPHIVQYIDSWESNNHLFIQTEYCSQGSLRHFLDTIGFDTRLDDFRIWKILLELATGIEFIHSADFIHLDLKPANVLITDDGVVKICDFGMACSWPAPAGIEGEGDREYIGPEILLGKYDKPADVFALGLMMVEIAGNVVLPDNGVTWQKLRAGDLSDVPSLSWTVDSSLHRDADGHPVSESECVVRPAERQQGPVFMIDAAHPSSLDKLVQEMITPDPSARPTAAQILRYEGLQWVSSHSQAGATIFEGVWGPASQPVSDLARRESDADTVMTDV